MTPLPSDPKIRDEALVLMDEGASGDSLTAKFAQTARSLFNTGAITESWAEEAARAEAEEKEEDLGEDQETTEERGEEEEEEEDDQEEDESRETTANSSEAEDSDNEGDDDDASDAGREDPDPRPSTPVNPGRRESGEGVRPEESTAKKENQVPGASVTKDTDLDSPTRKPAASSSDGADLVAEPSEAGSVSPTAVRQGDRVPPYATGLFQSPTSVPVLDSQLENTSLARSVRDLTLAVRQLEGRLEAVTFRMNAAEKTVNSVHARGQKLESLVKDLGARMADFDEHSLAAVNSAAKIIREMRPDEKELAGKLESEVEKSKVSAQKVVTEIVAPPIQAGQAKRRKMFDFI